MAEQGERDFAGRISSVQKNVSACDVSALRKCLEENKGDRDKCKREIEAFRTSCSPSTPNRPPAISRLPATYQ